MITSEKLAVYRKFDGDGDNWSRGGYPKREIFDDSDWDTIRNLLQELTLLKRDFVSREYGEQIRRRLSEMSADEGVSRELMEMA